MSTLAEPTPCPRCGTTPINITTMGGPNRWVPACTCYPHPPRCPWCHVELTDGACSSYQCFAYAVLVPLPDIDPLWETP